MSAYGPMDKECPMPEPFGANLGNLIAIALLLFLSFMVRFIFAPLMPTIESDLGITHAQAGSLFLLVSVGMFISQCLSGHLSSRLNHRGTLFVSTLGLGAPLLWLYFDSGLLSLYGVMFVIGLGAGLHMPSAIATITGMVTRQDWGKALGIHGSAPPLGLAIAPFLSVILLYYFSWQSIVISLGMITMAAAFVFLRYCSCGDFPGEPPRLETISAVLGQGSFWIMVILFALFLGGSIGIYTMLSLYLIQEAGIPADTANSLLGLSRLSGLVVTFLSGIMMDRIGEKKHIVWVMAASGLATILLGSTSGILLVIMIFVQPALLGCFPTAGFSALARTVQPNLRSTATSFLAPFSLLIGGGIAPTLLGYMGQVYSFSAGIIVMGCLIAIGPALVFFLKLLDKLDVGC